VTANVASPVQVLAVDDQPDNLMLVEEILLDAGFQVRTAVDGVEALEEVERQPPDCIVLDVMMPRMDGVEACRQLKTRRSTRFIPVVMLTALTSVEDKVRAFDAGADDFLNKPVDARELVRRVRSMARIKGVRDALDTSENVVFALAGALEGSDEASAGHSQRVMELALLTGRKVGLEESELEALGKASLLHDVGKIGMEPGILATHNVDETAESPEYRQHPERGEQILAPFLSFARIRSLVRHHHERRDGSGFPSGLRGDQVDETLEILALANHADALAIRLGDPEAVAEQLRCEAAEGVFTPALVDVLLEVRRPNPVGSMTDWSQLMPQPVLRTPGEVVLATDTVGVARTARRALGAAGHRVVVTSTTDDHRSSVVATAPDLVILDPGPGTGVDPDAMARELREVCPRALLPVLLITTGEDLRALSATSDDGVDDVLLQPLDATELTARAGSMVRLGTYFRDLEERHSVILGLAAALEAKDPYTRGHSERVGILAGQIGSAMRLDDETCARLRMAGQLHDIGKIGLPGGLLNKTSRLSEEEFREVRRHPVLTARICEPLRTLSDVIPIARHHHERWDGSGYPDGLEGEAIPLGARILGLADAFDALTSARSYRTSYSPAAALAMLTEETESGRWDPKVLAALRAVVRRDSPM
jgi:putative two-component system response regulator